ncbi:unnamed protein product [Calypogeia fissa]
MITQLQAGCRSGITNIAGQITKGNTGSFCDKGEAQIEIGDHQKKTTADANKTTQVHTQGRRRIVVARKSTRSLWRTKLNKGPTATAEVEEAALRMALSAVGGGAVEV